MKATAETQSESSTDTACCHHWLLGQPIDGVVPAVCRKCGLRRGYPAVLDDLDPPAEPVKTDIPEGVATAVGGARPSSVASAPEAVAPEPAKLKAVAAPAKTRRQVATPPTGRLTAVGSRARASLSVD